MSPITLTLKEKPHVPLEAEALSPDVLGKLSHAEVCAQTVYLGKRQLRLGELFEVEGDGSDELVIRGETTNVKWIGKGMSHGKISIHGNAGMHLGAYMTGGTIEVQGNASDWAGAEMRNGLIRIRGNAGGQIGAAYRGSPKGMRGGTIVIDGSAGMEVGMRMRRGVIVVKGQVRDFVGLQMKGGTIFLMRGAELRTGAWMTRGTIVSLVSLHLLPTFAFACDYNPSFLRVFAHHLRSLGVGIPCSAAEGSYLRHVGDMSIPGKGEILIWQPGVRNS
jgi:formylmethanofuran dehydrogenase subunit C